MSGLYYDVTVTIDGTDVSPFVHAGATIDYGRPTINSGYQCPRAVLTFPAGFDPQPAPSMSWLPTVAGFWGAGFFIGADVQISVTWDGFTQWRRFTGRIWSIDWNSETVTITALGYTFEFEGITYGYTPPLPGVPRPIERDLERVQWLASETGVNITNEGTLGRYVTAIPAAIPNNPRPLLDWLLELEASCDSLLYEDRFAVAYYRARVWSEPARYTIPAGIIRRDNIDMVLEGGEITNEVDVYYGSALTNYVNDSDAGSQATIGVRKEEISTILQYQVGAAGKARTYLSEHGEAWHAPDITAVLGLATGAQADDIFTLYEGYPVRVTPFPDNAPLYTYDASIIGITDVLHPYDYRVVLHMSPGIDATPGLEFPEYNSAIYTYNQADAGYGA